MDILSKVRKTIKKYLMISEGYRILIGLSGGPDSVCLAVILDKLKADFNLSLIAVYIDHGLRPDETEKEKDFCRKFCKDRGIGFIEKSVDAKGYAQERGLNLQEAARELRYQIYEDVAKEIKADAIALGHNANDQAETVLMRLLRGSGRKGLSGIPPVRGKIIRPLIEIERSDIEAFLSQDMCLNYMTDSSNLKDDYLRNWIRLTIMEELKKKNPSVVKDICRTADIFREEDEYLELIVTKTLMRLISRKDDNSIQLFLAPLEMIERPILRRALRRAVDATHCLRRITYDHIENIIDLIKNGKAGDRLSLPDNVRVIKDYSVLIITTDKPVKISEYEIHPPCEIFIEGAELELKATWEKDRKDLGDGKFSVLLDAGNMHFPLKVRSRAEGDYFYPMGFGKRKKLQDFFVDEKVPRDERDRIPIVVSGNDIIWVAGYRADERFKVTDKTEKYLRLTITKTHSTISF
jgi:tRNA(Ile)-lysidine synthase